MFHGAFEKDPGDDEEAVSMPPDRIQVECPSCGRRLSKALAGGPLDRVKVRCPICDHEFWARRPPGPTRSTETASFPRMWRVGRIGKPALAVGLLLTAAIVLSRFFPGDPTAPSPIPRRAVPSAAILPAAGAGASSLSWAFSALVGESLAAADGVSVVPLPRAALLDRDLGGLRSSLAIERLARALGTEAMFLLEVTDGSPPMVRARLVRPATGEVRSLTERVLVFGHVSRGAATLAREMAHLLGPMVVTSDAGLPPLQLPEERPSLEALGEALRRQADGDTGGARDVLRQILGAGKQGPYLLNVLAGLDLAVGDHTAAARRAAEAQGRAPGQSSRGSLRNHVLELQAAGRPEEAARALAGLRERGRFDLEEGLWEIRLLLSAGLAEEARTALESVTAALPRAGGEDPRLELARAAVLQGEGAFADQLTAARRAADLAEALGDRRQQSLALLDVGAALVAAGDLMAARQATEESRSLADSLQAPSLMARGDNALALVLALAGDREAAERAFAQAFEGFGSLGLPAAGAAVLVNRGRLRSSWGDPDGAAEDLQRAVTIYDDLGDQAGRRGALRALARMENTDRG